jgi:hypothetical protein
MTECIKYLDSFEEVSSLVSTVQERRIFSSYIMEHYRGQGRPEYKLLPNISRNVSDPQEILSNEARLISAFKCYLEKESIENILRIDNVLTESQNVWNILIQMQHLAIPTRLLDWTLKWEVGLWFAVEKPENDNVDGQFWIFSPLNEIHATDTRDNFYNKDLNNLDKTYLINAPIYWSDDLKNQIGEIRRQRQFGKFSISSFEKSIVPLENQPAVNIYLEKYCIKAKAKKHIRLRLASLGLQDEWLYYRDANTELLEKINKIVHQLPCESFRVVK